MNALFDEQNNIVAEHSADSIIPETSLDLVTLHHESFLMDKIDDFLTSIGGVVHNSHKAINLGGNHA